MKVLEKSDWRVIKKMSEVQNSLARKEKKQEKRIENDWKIVVLNLQKENTMENNEA